MMSEIDEQRRTDLNKYIKTLPTCELYEDRIFFICGIINLFKQLDDLPWKHGKKPLYRRLIDERLEQGHTASEIEKRCCVPRGQLGSGHYDRTIIGCLYGF